MSLVEVIVPCYNYGRFLRPCVESVFKQQGVEVRVLVIDDASQDESERVGRALAAQDQRVTYRRHAVNRGHIATYNEGIDWLSGDYALLLSADDMLTAGALARAARVLNTHPEAGFAFGRAIKTVNPEVNGDRPDDHFDWKVISGDEFLRISCETGGNVVPTPTLVVRTSMQKRVGGYRPELPHTGDLEICMRMAAHGAVAVLDAPQAYYRLHGQNMHQDTFKDALVVMEQHREAFRTVFDEHGARLPDCDHLRGLAARALARGAVRRAGKAFEAGDNDYCRVFLRYALAQDPAIRKDSAWFRLSVKRALGAGLWRRVRPVVRFLRKKRILDPSPFETSGIFPGL